MPRAEDKNVIQTVAPQRSNQTLRIGVLPPATALKSVDLGSPTFVFFEQFRKGLTRVIEQNACAGEPQTRARRFGPNGEPGSSPAGGAP